MFQRTFWISTSDASSRPNWPKAIAVSNPSTWKLVIYSRKDMSKLRWLSLSLSSVDHRFCFIYRLMICNLQVIYIYICCHVYVDYLREFFHCRGEHRHCVGQWECLYYALYGLDLMLPLRQCHGVSSWTNFSCPSYKYTYTRLFVSAQTTSQATSNASVAHR